MKELSARTTPTRSKPKDTIELYVIDEQERKRRNQLTIRLSEAWYDLSCYYQLSTLGNVRYRGKPLTSILRDGESYYQINNIYYSQTELMDLL